MDTKTYDLTDAAAAREALNTARDGLKKALDAADAASKALRQGILAARPAGVLTVDEMAAAVGRDRNYIDSVWSSHGETQKGRQTRVATVQATEDERTAAAALLADLARAQHLTSDAVDSARAERDRLVVQVYAAKLTGVGPSAIGHEVAMDRNHVLRVARKAGVPPMHRANSHNQHTTKD